LNFIGEDHTAGDEPVPFLEEKDTLIRENEDEQPETNLAKDIMPTAEDALSYYGGFKSCANSA
jgi:hypothetical protein